MLLLILGILIAIMFLGYRVYDYICTVPHGRVEFKTGIVLKFVPNLDHQHPVALRKYLEAFAARYKHLIRVPVDVITDFQISILHGEIDCRLYDHSAGTKDDCILYIHGGGWCIGSIEVFEEQSRRLAVETRIPVISINYSLAPEFPFPRAHEECLAIAEQLLIGIDLVSCKKLIIIGDSAGGNMALSVARTLSHTSLRDRLRAVVAIYPVTNATSPETESRRAYAHDYYLTERAMMNFTQALFTSTDQLSDPRIDLLNTGGWEAMPPVLVITAEFDPLRDEGEAMAEKLKQAAVHTEIRRYQGAIHAFFGLKGFGSQGLRAVQDVAVFLKAHE